MMNDSDNVWRKLGKTEPYSAIIAHESRADFFESGERHVDEVFRVIREQLDAQYRPARALDFGCGVGRIVIPLARLCEEVVGVDISHEMLAEARRNCNERTLDNVELVSSLSEVAATDDRFDLVHSHIVLQHIPPRRGMVILAQLIDLVAAGGIGALDLQHSRNAPIARRVANWCRPRLPFMNNLANLVQGLPVRHPRMQMHVYPLAKVFRLLHAYGCHNVVLRLTATETGGYVGAMVLFRKEERDLTLGA